VQAIHDAGGFVTYPFPAERIATGEDGQKIYLSFSPVIPMDPERSAWKRFLLGYQERDLPEMAYMGELDAAGQESLPDGDAWIAHVAPAINKLPTIRSLDLSQSQITGEACRTLSNMPYLREVWFEGTALSDADIDSLALLMQFDRIYLYETQVTEQGIQQLAALLPHCDIEHETTALTPAEETN